MSHESTIIKEQRRRSPKFSVHNINFKDANKYDEYIFCIDSGADKTLGSKTFLDSLIENFFLGETHK